MDDAARRGLAAVVGAHRRAAAAATQAQEGAKRAVEAAKATRRARNDAIRAAWAGGAALSELQEVTGLSTAGLQVIIRRGEN